MSGSYGRHERVAGQLRRVIADLIWSEVKDPRLGPVSVTDVEVSRDLGVAKVYVATSEPETIKDSLGVLRRAGGFLRSRLSRELTMRSVPELRFIHDDSIERGDRIEELLAKAARKSHD